MGRIDHASPTRLRWLNAYAEEGWAVISIATANIPSFTGAREELVVVMEREK